MYSFLLSSLAVGSAVIVAASVVWYVLTVIGNWKIFEKAGEAPWKSIIPFLNTYTDYKIAWKGVYGIVFIVLSSISTYYNNAVNTYQVYQTQTIQNGEVVAEHVVAAPSTALTIVGLVAGIAVIIFNFLKAKKLAKAFGKSTGFMVGLFLFEPLFRILLGFGSDEYIGPEGNSNAPKTFM